MSLRHAILAKISSRPRTGYELSRSIEGSVGFFWSATHQQIYRELKAIEEVGWATSKSVRQSEKPDKKVYRITEGGLDELKRWIALDAEPTPTRDALLVKVSAGAFAEPGALLRVLEAQARARRERLERYRAIEGEHFKTAASRRGAMGFQYLTLRRGILFEESWLAWADEVRAFLK